MEVPLIGNRRGSALKCVVAILCAVCFLTVSLGSISPAAAADEWEVWPKKPAQPGAGDAEAGGAADAGRAGGKKTWAGLSGGTIGWIAGGTALVIGIAIAASSGGSSSNH